MTASCARLWEVEAVFDGRLTGAERASWERHATSCSSCSREWRSLGALRELVQAGAIPELSPLEARRARAQLLELADANATGRHRAATRRWPLLAAAAVVATCTIGGALTYRRATAVPRPRAATVAIDASPDARWHEERGGTRRRVHLDAGSLTLRIDRAQVIVLTPDGEIEDTGTTFTVSVNDRHTERVSVAEGSVIVRLDGRAPFDVRAGGSWSLPAPVAIAALDPPAPNETSDVPPPRVTAAQRAPRAPVTPSAVAAPEPLPPDAAATEFGAAMQVFGEGRLADAAALFQAFERAHGGSPKAEDAGYLRVVALDRGGRRNAARIAAREYLTRYPNGFRRKEVESLAAVPLAGGGRTRGEPR